MRKLTLTFAYLLLVIFCSSPVIATDGVGPSVLMGGIHYVNGVEGNYPEENLVTGYQRHGVYVLRGPKYVPNEIIVKFNRAAAARLEEGLHAGSKVEELKLTDSLDELKQRYQLGKIESIFKGFRGRRERLEALSGKDKTLLSKRERRLLRRLKRAPPDAKVPALGRIYKLEVVLEEGQSVEEVVAAYQNDQDVEYAELNYIVSIVLEPNDPNYSEQWALNNTGQMYPESGRYRSPPGTPDCDIDAPEAWDIYTGSSETIVAVVDTGVDYDHRDLAGNIWVNEAELNGSDGVDDDENGYVDDVYGYDFVNEDSNPVDDHGHGTHCAGIITAKGNNGLDISGVCWHAQIMSLKFLAGTGYGDVIDAIQAFYYAVENGADVISNSWGGGGYVESMQEAINYAHSQGVILVAASGNDNSNSVYYPALYEHMIAVAATDSNDDKATFSNYGDWVNLAAPGVDILSLRAGGTSMGTTYGDYLTVASGTSMACPYVAGACALLISTNPSLTSDDVNDILTQTGDPILPGICASNGRLNIFNAILVSTTSQGVISLDRDYYSCSSVINIWLTDSDLSDNNSQDVNLVASGGDLETVLLTQKIPTVGIFTGSISISSGEPNSQDGVVQVSHDQVITVTYEDTNDGTGSPATVTDTATTDCQSPVISNVQIDVPGSEPNVSFDTNEPTVAKVFYGVSCIDPDAFMKTDSTLSTSHSIKLVGVSPETTYYFTIHAIDVANNETIDANGGQCYSFTTDGPGDINVPAEYPTIQEAIDRSWDGGMVRIADGTYTGAGNRDIDFKGRAITVKSENGPENCIIDCNGTESESHRGFYFHSGEDANSILSGFTITNGYVSGSWGVGIGGGISNQYSNPTITNCIITGNSAGWDGGGINNNHSNPTITNCTFSRNSAVGNDGGGINSEFSSPTITNCSFIGNLAYDWGGAIRNLYFCNPTITNCTFTGNSADDGGAMFYFSQCSPTITNSTIAGNSAPYGNALACDSLFQLFASNIQITNCILWDGGDEITNYDTSTIDIIYSDVQGSFSGMGNIDADPCFAEAGYWADVNDSNIIVEPNDPNAVWVDGDYHLQSQAGRWDSNSESWLIGSVTSRCIDAGNPGSPLGDEPNDVNNMRINMGAYGGTAEASMPPYDWALLSDLTNDGTVDFVDFAYFADIFTDQDDELPGDFDLDGDVDLADLDWLTYDWLLQTIWYEP